MDYLALSNELKNDPENLGYASMNNAMITTVINQPSSAFTPPLSWTVQQPFVPLTLFLATVGGNGALDALNEGLTNSNSTIRSLCRAGMMIFTLPSISTFNPQEYSTFLSTLVGAGILTQSQVDDINNLVNVPNASRAEVLFGYGISVTFDDIAIAQRVGGN